MRRCQYVWQDDEKQQGKKVRDQQRTRKSEGKQHQENMKPPGLLDFVFLVPLVL